jgi:hypothetical protein
MAATETLLQGATQVTSSLSANYTAGGGTISMAAALVDHGGAPLTGPFEILVGRNRPSSERRYFVATPSGSNLTVTASPGYTDNQNFITGDLIDVISAWETQRRLRAFALLHTHTGGTGTVDGPVLAHTALSSIGTNTHAQVDTHIAASAAHGIGAWTAWTPASLTQSVAVTFTATRCRYKIIDKLAVVQFKITITSAGTAGSALVLGVPAALTPAAADDAVGAFYYFDVGTSYYAGTLLFTSSTVVGVVHPAASGYFGSVPNFAVANTDTWWGQMTYEVP